MPAKLDPANIDKAIELYLTGESMEQIASDTGVTSSTLFRARKARGIPPRTFKVLPDSKIVDAYESGASEYALSRQYEVSRYVIRKRLVDAGVKIRRPSEAGKVRAAKMTPEQRKAQAAGAKRANRLRTSTQIDKFRRALTNEARGEAQSIGEERLKVMLEERGYTPTPQRAIGIYNVDLAILPVAVEVLGGGWHSMKSTHAERTPQILDAGWHLVMVWDHEGRSALGPGAADYLVAFVEEVRRNPPATCQYRVITGQGEVLAACGREDDEFTLVPPPRGRI